MGQDFLDRQYSYLPPAYRLLEADPGSVDQVRQERERPRPGQVPSALAPHLLSQVCLPNRDGDNIAIERFPYLVFVIFFLKAFSLKESKHFI